MPKWKADSKEFTVAVNSNSKRGSQTTIPRPVMEKLGNPSKVKFMIKETTIEVVRGEKTE